MMASVAYRLHLPEHILDRNLVFMPKEHPKQSVADQKFWDAFNACVEDNRVRPDRSGFYVKWVQAFVNSQPGKRLRDRSRQ